MFTSFKENSFVQFVIGTALTNDKYDFLIRTGKLEGGLDILTLCFKSLLVDVPESDLFYYKTRSKASQKILKGWPIGSLGSNVFLATDMPK